MNVPVAGLSFSEALGGEFAPPSDPQRRKHRLSRLLIATTQKGEYLRGSGGAGYKYVPSWAPEVESNVFCEVRDGLHVVRSLALGQVGVDAQTIFLTINEKDEQGVIGLSTPTGALDLPLALGNDMQETTNTLAAIAQGFFDHFPNRPS